jgi:hypothetical protein
LLETLLSVIDRGDCGLPRAYTHQIAKLGRTSLSRKPEVVRTKPKMARRKPEVALKVLYGTCNFLAVEP